MCMMRNVMFRKSAHELFDYERERESKGIYKWPLARDVVRSCAVDFILM